MSKNSNSDVNVTENEIIGSPTKADAFAITDL